MIYITHNRVWSKLTEKQVAEIRQLLTLGKLSQVEISKKFGVSQAVISKIKNNKSWKQ